MTVALTAGVHDIPSEMYHADCCPEPSLTSSGIKRLLTGSPAEFRAHHPRLTQWPALLDAPSEAKDIGQVVHSIVLGKGCEFVTKDPGEFVIPSGKNKGRPYKTWSGIAKAWKDEQEASGVMVFDSTRSAAVQAAAQSMVDLLTKEYGDWPIGDSEQTLIWQRDTSHGPIWCRALVDHLALRHMLVLDPKSTDLPINNRALAKKIASEMWHIQAAWYVEGVEQCHSGSNLTGRLTFRFPVVEIGPPFQARFVDLPETWINIARQRCDRAAELFAKCLYANEWPPYSSVCAPDVPSWLISEFEAEELQS